MAQHGVERTVKFACRELSGPRSVLLRGQQADAGLKDAAAKRLTRDPTDLEARLLLIGASVPRDTSYKMHILYLIERNPEIDLGPAWALDPAHLNEARTAWASAMARHSEDPNVFANAAWGTFEDLEFSDAAYEAGRVLGPRARAWHLQMACFYELRRHAHAQQSGRFALIELRARFQALHLEDSPQARLQALWELRQCAAATGNTEIHECLRLADQLGTRAAGLEQQRSGFRHHLLHAAMGLAALAASNVAEANTELLESIRLELDAPPDMTLADKLLNAGQRDVVADYLGRCADNYSRLRDRLKTARAGVQTGALERLSEFVEDNLPFKEE